MYVMIMPFSIHAGQEMKGVVTPDHYLVHPAAEKGGTSRTDTGTTGQGTGIGVGTGRTDTGSVVVPIRTLMAAIDPGQGKLSPVPPTPLALVLAQTPTLPFE